MPRCSTARSFHSKPRAAAASSSATAAAAEEDPAIRRLLGIDPIAGSEEAGLPPHWSRNIIAGSGNYGEIFDRYLGKDSQIKVGRGANKLWRDGGLMFSPPLR